MFWRVQDSHESSGDKLILLFLDWAKTFDKLEPRMLRNAFWRPSIPDKILNIIGIDLLTNINMMLEYMLIFAPELENMTHVTEMNSEK